MYETQQDRDSELEIIKVAAARWGSEYKKLPEKANLDFLLLRDGVFRALAEVKNRNYTYAWLDAHGGYMISCHKIERAWAYAALLRVRTLLIVRCHDSGIYYTELRNKNDGNLLELVVPGVTYRDQWRLTWFDGNIDFRREGDREPVFMIPMAGFKLLTTGKPNGWDNDQKAVDAQRYESNWITVPKSQIGQDDSADDSD